jgi:5-formyltetrahydrofolate cyclo-ligase
MHFARWDEDAALVPNRFGIDEPAPPLEDVAPAELDVVLVPCVAVDADGNRVGFGAGFYDRAFARPDTGPDATTPPRRAVLVGVVHDVQLVDRIEPDPWDVPMDLIVTGSRVVRTRRRG